MKEQYHKWYSPSIDRDFEMLVFGHAGFPVILFPTSKGRYYQNKDAGLIETARWFLDNGLVRIYCPDSIDTLSWYNKSVSPAIRAYNHTCYDRLILKEVVSRAQNEGHTHFVGTAGCSFGGYHAVNFGLRHPDVVSHIFSMSGAFDMRQFMEGSYNDDLYYNNPIDFISGDNDPGLWKLNITLGCGDQDICRADNERLSKLLSARNIPHWLDVRPNAVHDWPLWKQLFPHYLSLIKR